ncbi:hypothetical protein MKW94_017566 [Papaver nudicaule]|uniref:Uncharacterized protein n=1 Tax=Papaver nudicaule TaxID=74823 RepID=A0AA41RYM5_PAPNU|nr:hypothetical protein [Papaver nudicaule]
MGFLRELSLTYFWYLFGGTIGCRKLKEDNSQRTDPTNHRLMLQSDIDNI